jgi:hypothetical protein
VGVAVAFATLLGLTLIRRTVRQPEPPHRPATADAGE